MIDNDESDKRDVWNEFRFQRDLLVEMRALLHALAATRDDHEVRLRRLEERRFPLPTITVLASIASVIVALLVMYLSK